MSIKQKCKKKLKTDINNIDKQKKKIRLKKEYKKR